MTKKDYELIAKVFNKQITRLAVLENEAKNDYEKQDEFKELNNAKITLIQFADRLAVELKSENRSFDYDKFLNCAGVLNNPHDQQS